MLPNEAQETIAKILFLVFATLMLCFGKVQASDATKVSAVVVKSL